MNDIKINADDIMYGELAEIMKKQIPKDYSKNQPIYIDFSYDEYNIESQMSLITNGLTDKNAYLDSFMLDIENRIKRILRNKNMVYTPAAHFQEKFTTLIELYGNSCRVVNFSGTNNQFEQLFNYCMIEKVLQIIKSIV